MAITGYFSNGILSLLADANGSDLTVSRSAAGTILVNSGAVSISGSKPTVANTSLVQVFGLGEDDFLTLDETNGGLPRASVFGGAGGSGADTRFGRTGNDTLFGRGAGLRFGVEATRS